MATRWRRVRSLVRAGVTAELEPRLQRRLVVNNVITVALALNTWVYAATLWGLGQTWLALSLIPISGIFPLALWLNHLGHYTANRFALITTPLLVVFVYTLAIGQNEVSLFLAGACLPLVICEVRERGLIAWGVGLSVVCAAVITVGGASVLGESLLSSRGSFILHIIARATTFTMLVATVASFEVSNERAERALRSAHHDIKRLLDRVNQGFVTLDAAGCIRRERSAIFDQWFAAPASATPFADCLGRLDAAAGDAFALAWREIAASRDPIELRVGRLPATATSAARHYRLEYRPDLDHDPGLSNLMVVISDVTDEVERERAEELQQTLQLELMHAHKLESVGRLAAGVAHEINTPIQFVGDSMFFVRESLEALLGLVGEYRQVCQAFAAGTAAPGDLERLAEAEATAELAYLQDHVPRALDVVQHGLARVTAIVRSMNAFAHPDGTELALADLNLALRSTISVASSGFTSVAEVETELGDIPQVRCYVGSLNQVFLNLIVNAGEAIEAAVAGTGTTGHITIRSYREHQAVVIAIADDGSGIAEDVRPRVFEQFFTTKPFGKGTGQGLAIARRIVTMHGGTLSFQTAVGKGTTFFVRLPLDVGDAALA